MKPTEQETPKPPATYADVENAPDDKIAELIDGELILSPRPRSIHSLAASTLSMDLGNPFQRGRGGPGGWWILFEVELYLRGNVVVPDLAGWKRERLPEVPNAAAISVPPDWVCEILSPSTEAIDRTKKLAVYARENVAFVWLLNPALRTLEALKLENGKWVLLGAFLGDEKVRAAPFDAVELELSALWGG